LLFERGLLLSLVGCSETGSSWRAFGPSDCSKAGEGRDHHGNEAKKSFAARPCLPITVQTSFHHPGILFSAIGIKQLESILPSITPRSQCP
jgi:hypothetical protein